MYEYTCLLVLQVGGGGRYGDGGRGSLNKWFLWTLSTMFTLQVGKSNVYGICIYNNWQGTQVRSGVPVISVPSGTVSTVCQLLNQ